MQLSLTFLMIFFLINCLNQLPKTDYDHFSKFRPIYTIKRMIRLTIFGLAYFSAAYVINYSDIIIKITTKNTDWLIALLLLAGDIESNPGPSPSINEMNPRSPANDLYENLDDLEVVDLWHESDSNDGSVVTIGKLDASDNETWELNDANQTGGQDHSPDYFYELGEPANRRVKKFSTNGLRYELKFKNLEEYGDLPNQITDIFNHATNCILSNVSDSRVVGAEFWHPDLKDPVVVPFKRREFVSGEQIVNQFQEILNSNQQIKLDNRAGQIHIITVEVPSGGNPHIRKKNRFILLDEFIKNKRCIIHINNYDNLCLARALVVARANLHKTDASYKWNNVRNDETNGYLL